MGGAGSGSTILVNTRQRLNPVLKNIKSVGWEWSEILADYQVGVSTGCLYLSLKYHQIHPEYIHQRISKISGMYSLRLLLVQADVADPQAALKELTKVALVNDFTLLVAWSAEESARYLETFKIFEHKPPDLIRERRKEDWLGAMTGCLTSVKGVNRTDAVGLLSRFGSLRNLSKATASDLSLVPGLGEIKVKRLREALTTPFRVGERRSFRERKAARLSRDLAEAGTTRRRRGDGDGDEEVEEATLGVDIRLSGFVTGPATSADCLAQTPKAGYASLDGPIAALDVHEAPSSAAPALEPTGVSAKVHVIEDLEDDFDLNEDDLAALEAIEQQGNLADGVDRLPRTRPNVQAGEEEFGDVTGLSDLGEDLEGLDELSEEEREELRKAMKMSLK